MPLYFATGNNEKVREAQAILGIPIEIVNIEIDEVQSMDLEYVARKKVEAVFAILQKPVIVDDVGLFIDAWSGFPGPFVKYFFKTLGNEGILRILENEKNRDVTVKNAIGYHDGVTAHVFIGQRRGKISHLQKGNDGWGFDPIIIPEGEEQTIAELGFEHKNKNSHRSKSLQMLKEFLDSQKR